MAEKTNITEEEMESEKMPAKTSDNTKEAPVEDESSEAPAKKDVDNLLMILNEVDQIAGGKGKIAGVPEELQTSLNFLIEKVMVLRDAYEDPLFKDMLDDLHEQKMDGGTPSVLVAIAKSVPIEELQKLADDEDYEGVQTAVKGRIDSEKEANESEEKMYGNFDLSKKNIEAYATKMGYDESRKQVLYKRIAKLRDIFADGLVTVEEAAEIDKIDNYDSDVESLKSQVPKNGVKTVLPDRASMDEDMVEAKTAKPKMSGSPMEANAGYKQPDYMNTGKRKFFNK